MLTCRVCDSGARSWFERRGGRRPRERDRERCRDAATVLAGCGASVVRPVRGTNDRVGCASATAAAAGPVPGECVQMCPVARRDAGGYRQCAHRRQAPAGPHALPCRSPPARPTAPPDGTAPPTTRAGPRLPIQPLTLRPSLHTHTPVTATRVKPNQDRQRKRGIPRASLYVSMHVCVAGR